jgi:hypothetical protein
MGRTSDGHSASFALWHRYSIVVRRCCKAKDRGVSDGDGRRDAPMRYTLARRDAISIILYRSAVMHTKYCTPLMLLFV